MGSANLHTIDRHTKFLILAFESNAIHMYSQGRNARCE